MDEEFAERLVDATVDTWLANIDLVVGTEPADAHAQLLKASLMECMRELVSAVDSG